MWRAVAEHRGRRAGADPERTACCRSGRARLEGCCAAQAFTTLKDPAGAPVWGLDCSWAPFALGQIGGVGE